METHSIIRQKDVCQTLGICHETLRLWVKKGLLPPGIKLGARAVGWLQTDIDQFITTRLQASRPSAKPSGERHA